MSDRDAWIEVNKSHPCPICGKDHACKISPDGAVAMCKRIEQGSFKQSNGWYFHRLIEQPCPAGGGSYRPAPKPKAAPVVNWEDRAKALEPCDGECLEALATATGIPAAIWAHLSSRWATADQLRAMHAGGAGWKDNPPDGAWAFIEHDGNGRAVGMTLRARDGRKGAPGGAKRGLIVPDDLHKLPDPVLAVEGASDVAACRALGLAAVGRPSNRAGAEDLADLLDGRDVLVVGERDGKPDGSWPGRDGAKAVAQQMAAKWKQAIPWTLPPRETKDARAWLASRVAGGLKLDDPQAMAAAGAELLEHLKRAAKTVKPEKRTQADALVDMARKHYRLGRSIDGEAFAVPVEGPAIAMMLCGGGSGLRAALAKAFRQRTGKTPSSSALADTMLALEGMAQDAEPEPLALRVAKTADGHIALDLGDSTGRAVVVKPTGWAIKDVSPVLFRRTALTAPLPTPDQAEPVDLLELRRLLNVTDDSWPLVVGWMAATLVADIAHAILLLDGVQGTGKTTAARLIIGLIDPSAVSTRSEPKDAEQWAVAAAGSWAFCIDNISHIAGWFSDALCKAVTGDGSVRRKLYTDDDLAVLAFRRCIALTSIDPGALRGDLGDRLLRLELEPIPEDKRRGDKELLADYHAMLPKALGALLSAAARTLEALPTVKLDRLPRLADFARVLAVLDRACPELTAGRALDLFADQSRRIVDDVIEADPVAVAIVSMMEQQGDWQGTAGQLMERITPEKAPKGWPADAIRLSGRLKRIRPALLAVGIAHTPPAKGDKRRIHRIEKAGILSPITPKNCDNGPESRIFDAPNVGDMEDAIALNGDSIAQHPGDDAEPPDHRPAGNGEFPAENNRLGDKGDEFPHNSTEHDNAEPEPAGLFPSNGQARIGLPDVEMEGGEL